MSGWIINPKDGEVNFDHLHHKMSENFRRTHMRNAGGSPGAQYKSEEEIKEAYCKGYEHGVEDAMKQMQGGDLRSSEFKYGM